MLCTYLLLLNIALITTFGTARFLLNSSYMYITIDINPSGWRVEISGKVFFFYDFMGLWPAINYFFKHFRRRDSREAPTLVSYKQLIRLYMGIII